jgi:hypothetical protein
MSAGGKAPRKVLAFYAGPHQILAINARKSAPTAGGLKKHRPGTVTLRESRK